MWDWTSVPCVGRWIINHQTKREIPVPGLKWKLFLLWDVQIGGELAPLGWAWLAVLGVSFILLGPAGQPGHVLLRAVGKHKNQADTPKPTWGWDAEWGIHRLLFLEHIRFVSLLGAWHCCQPVELCPQTPCSTCLSSGTPSWMGLPHHPA